MDPRLFKIGVIVVACIILQAVLNRVLVRIALKFGIQKERRKLINKAINLVLYIIAIVLILMIYSMDQSNLWVYISSFLTVLGVAFVAQWSLLSNITAAVLLFVNHPVKIGDEIEIMDKEYPVKGKVSDIGLFFLHIRISEYEKVTLPNSVVLNKMVKVISEERP
ncbi:mechanosensitive ion channel domain-containing protein [Lishizhenia sp.]|uniref:mechanosensitive ion channel domain-containing protein n=1 Tax=Lishizhenia sp. TaxID=2497594 RepID=UPI00299F262E|nr:mechanosensitive ion channel domain-containing protein [Lishizhenia sp.]MDX1445714.1 mechanosensitive ion channel [Lishizhenia sp.]